MARITSATRLVAYDMTGYSAALLPVGVDPSVLVNDTRPINGPGASINAIVIRADRPICRGNREAGHDQYG